MKPRKSKTINEEKAINKMLDADFEHQYYDEHLDHVPDIVEGLGEDL